MTGGSLRRDLVQEKHLAADGAGLKARFQERRDRRTAHCDYREHLKSLAAGAGNWARG